MKLAWVAIGLLFSSLSVQANDIVGWGAEDFRPTMSFDLTSIKTREGCRNLAYASYAADILSTYNALENGAIEGNPLLGESPSPLVLLASGGVRALYSWALSQTEHHQLNCAMSAVGMAVAINNLYVVDTTAVSSFAFTFTFRF